MIYLASQSPRRAELLQQIGVDFRLLLPQSAAEKQAAEDLEVVLADEAPAAYVQRVTALKAQAALVAGDAEFIPLPPDEARTRIRLTGRWQG